MKAFFKSFVALALLSSFLFLGGYLYYRKNDGFRMSNVVLPLPPSKEWDLHPLSQEELALVARAFNQPYHYLDKGHQAYVFESEDGQFVLKLMKFQRVRIPEWLRRTRLPIGEEWRLKKIAKKDQMLHRLLTSLKLAFEQLKDEAAIVYVHINPTQEFGKPLTIRDKLGISHQLDLDHSIYLVQRKVPLLGPTLDNLMVEGKEEAAKQLLSRLIALFVSEYQRGLAEKELFILRNTGVYNQQPVHIDTGRFEWDFSLKNNYKSELKRKTIKLLQWLKEKYPQLADHFEKQIS